MMIRVCVFVCAAIVGLSGCTSPVENNAANREDSAKMFEIKFPAVMLVQMENGDETFLEGSMFGHMSGSARYLFPDSDWGDCKGNYKKDGTASLVCTNGFDYTINYGKQRPKMSGVNVVKTVVDGQSSISAFGWGKDANLDAVQQAIAKNGVGS